LHIDGTKSGKEGNQNACSLSAELKRNLLELVARSLRGEACELAAHDKRTRDPIQANLEEFAHRAVDRFGIIEIELLEFAP
jgi:hypothetical protein